jgi:outer membrane murein-binding lipoprotein Lpp
MRRAAIIFGLLLLSGCQALQEHNRLQPLPTDGPALPYREVVQKSRNLATAATEAFYVDKWSEVELAAVALEQTALYLPRSYEIPEARKTSLDSSVKTLVKEAQALREAAKAKDETKTNETLQRIHLRVRELREQ